MTANNAAALDRRPAPVFKLGRWGRFVLKRFVGLIAVLACLLVATFLMIHLVPGDPALRVAGINVTAADLAAIRQTLGLNDPLDVQFVHYLQRVARLDFGNSFTSHEPVVKIISDRLPRTIQLALVALVLIMSLSIPIGMLAGAFTREGRHKRFELGFMAITSIGGALPEYLAGTLLAFIFAVWLRWLPVSGANKWNAIILPALAISIRPIATLSRIVRVETLNVLAQDYMRTARSKRLPRRLLYLRHALPNVLTGALTIGGLIFAELLGGTVITENVFAWPGLGTAVVQAVIKLDYPVIQGVILLFGCIVVVINTIVDVLLALIDPRSIIKDT